MVGQAVPLQPMEAHGEEDIHRQPVGRTHIVVVCQELYPMGRTHAGAGEQCKEEGVAATKYYGLTASLIPHPPPPLRGRR